MKLRLSVLLITIALIGTTVSPLDAYEWSLGRSSSVELLGQINYAVRFRTEDPHPRLKMLYVGNPDFAGHSKLAMPNDGNILYDKWDLVNNKYTTIWELQIKGPHWGGFFRDEIFLDQVFLDGDEYSVITNREKYSKETQQHAMFNFHDALEFYVEYKSEKFTGRAGRQIIIWGESIAPVQTPTCNMPNAMNAAKATSAGYTVRDFFVPTWMLWLNYESDNISIETIYAPFFDPREGLMVNGTFGSPVNLIGFGADDNVSQGSFGNNGFESFMTLPKLDRRPRDFEEMQQYGMAIKAVVPWLNYAELGLYYMHYRNRLPMMQMNVAADMPVGVDLWWPEVDMYGASAAHTIQAFDLGVQLSLEVAYRPNDPMGKHFFLWGNPTFESSVLRGGTFPLDTMGPQGGYDECDTINWSLTGMKMLFDVLPFTPWTVGCTVLGEFYGGWNMDYHTAYIEKADGSFIKRPVYSRAEVVYFYMMGPTFSSSDMIDNTKVDLGISGIGALHESQRHCHALGMSLKGKYGDSFEVQLNYDLKIGDIDEEVKFDLGASMMDRDALTLKFTYYFI